MAFSRPDPASMTSMAHGVQGWDATINDNFSKLGGVGVQPSPMAVVDYDSFSVANALIELESDYPAASYPLCTLYVPSS